MDEIFDQVYLGNSVKVYCIVAAVILFIVLVKRYIAHYVARLIFMGVKRIWPDVDRVSFTSMVVKPLGFFLAVLVSVATLNKLNFPEEINFDIYKLSLKELVAMVGTIVLIFSFFRLILSMIEFIAMILSAKATREHDSSDNQLIVFFKDFIKVFVSIVGLLLIMKYAFGMHIGNLLTGLSIVGAAIALALRESLENLIASFIIFFDKPFTVGDVVKVNAFTGTIEKVGLRSTRIRTDQKTFITVPNKQMVDTIIDNLSLRTQRRADLRLELGLSASREEIHQLVEGIRAILNRREIESATVMLSDITSSAYIVNSEYYTGPIAMGDFNKVKEEVNFSVMELLEKLKIEIAGASADIKILSSEHT